MTDLDDVIAKVREQGGKSVLVWREKQPDGSFLVMRATIERMTG